MIKDSDGKVIYENKKQSNVAMSERAAATMLDVLRSVVNVGTGTPARLPNMPVGGKTGTTDDYVDRWFVGVTPYYTAAVWVGYDVQQTVSGYSVNPAAALWKAVMSKAHEGLEYKNFNSTGSAKKERGVCKDSGKLASDLCYQDYRGSRVTVNDSFVGDEVCTLHKYVQVDKTTGKIAGKECILNNIEVRIQPSDGTEEPCHHDGAAAVQSDVSVIAEDDELTE